MIDLTQRSHRMWRAWSMRRARVLPIHRWRHFIQSGRLRGTCRRPAGAHPVRIDKPDQRGGAARVAGVAIGPLTTTAVRSAPGIFSLDGTGTARAPFQPGQNPQHTGQPGREGFHRHDMRHRPRTTHAHALRRIDSNRPDRQTDAADPNLHAFFEVDIQYVGDAPDDIEDIQQSMFKSPAEREYCAPNISGTDCSRPERQCCSKRVGGRSISARLQWV
jgi:hypothetical protein